VTNQRRFFAIEKKHITNNTAERVENIKKKEVK
jgi:hypothetical protein